MTPHPAALEAYNRATFDPPTPELQLAPAEEVQREPVERPTISLRFGLALLALSLSLIAVHSVWAAGLEPYQITGEQ